MIEVSAQLLEQLEVEAAAIDGRHRLDAQELEPDERVVPAQVDLALPNREAVEVGLQVVVCDTVLGIHVLAADANALGNVMRDRAMKLLNPIPARMMSRVERPGMHAIAVERRVLAIELFGHDDLLPDQAVQVLNAAIIILQTWRPG